MTCTIFSKKQRKKWPVRLPFFYHIRYFLSCLSSCVPWTKQATSGVLIWVFIFLRSKLSPLAIGAHIIPVWIRFIPAQDCLADPVLYRACMCSYGPSQCINLASFTDSYVRYVVPVQFQYSVYHSCSTKMNIWFLAPPWTIHSVDVAMCKRKERLLLYFSFEKQGMVLAVFNENKETSRFPFSKKKETWELLEYVKQFNLWQVSDIASVSTFWNLNPSISDQCQHVITGDTFLITNRKTEEETERFFFRIRVGMIWGNQT